MIDELDTPPDAHPYSTGPLAVQRPTPSVAAVRASGLSDLASYMRPKVEQAVPAVLSQAQQWAERARIGIANIFGPPAPVAQPMIASQPLPLPIAPAAPAAPVPPPVSPVYKQRLAAYNK